MGVKRDVNVTIKGQVPNDWRDNDYDACGYVLIDKNSIQDIQV